MLNATIITSQMRGFPTYRLCHWTLSDGHRSLHLLGVFKERMKVINELSKRSSECCDRV